MKAINWTPSALKGLKKAPANIRKNIRTKMLQYAENPESLRNNVKKLQGREASYRLRVGDYRVIFSEDGTVIDIIRVASRSNAY